MRACPTVRYRKFFAKDWAVRLLAFLLLLPALSFAQVPHAFNNGEVADADKINENFERINERSR
jgi:hypothetical protein